MLRVPVTAAVRPAPPLSPNCHIGASVAVHGRSLYPRADEAQALFLVRRPAGVSVGRLALTEVVRVRTGDVSPRFHLFDAKDSVSGHFLFPTGML